MEKKQELEVAFEKYAESMKEVRSLSSPTLEKVEDADDYSRLLIYNFKRIGELAGENCEMIDQFLMPLINKSEPLSEDEISALEGLNQLLINLNGEDVMDVDSRLAELASDRIEKERSAENDFEETGESAVPEESMIRMLDKNIEIFCQKMYSYLRGHAYEEAERIQKKGLQDYQKIQSFLEKERFCKLSEELKMMVLTNVVYGANFYDYFNEKKMLSQLAYARTILKDPFYQEGVPSGYIDRCVFQTYEYAAEMVYFDEYRYEETYREAYENAIKLKALWLTNPESYGEIMDQGVITTLCLYGAVKTNDPSLEKYLEEAHGSYERRDISDYSYKGMYFNLDVATMLFDVIEIARNKGMLRLPEQYIRLQRKLPYDMITYLCGINNAKISSFFLNTVGNLMEAFRDVPGGIKGGELFLKLIVVLHPPTYVHSCMVAKFSLCLARHLIETKPEIFVDFPGCQSREKVLENKDEILDYVYYAALYHDLGKLMILDTIAMYGRKLLDSEFNLLKTHPDNGARIAGKLPSMKNYVDVIRGHHIWYDGSHGYPSDFCVRKSPYKTVIDIVMTADCLDAATDSVGRSYSKGKTLEDYKKELREGAGTRYAPYLVELFEDPIVDSDLHYLLDEGRKELYRETFRLLKDVSRKH